jgi:hypothetical protein
VKNKAEGIDECGMTVVSNNGGEACDKLILLSNMVVSACSQSCTPRNDNDVHLFLFYFYLAIMAIMPCLDLDNLFCDN